MKITPHRDPIKKKLINQLVKLEKDHTAFKAIYESNPVTFTTLTDFFYQGDTLKKRRFARYGERVAMLVIKIINHFKKMVEILKQAAKKYQCYPRNISGLLETRINYLSRMFDEFLVAAYDMRINDLREDRRQINISITDTLFKLNDRIAKFKA